jgi:hypothetical protein
MKARTMELEAGSPGLQGLPCATDQRIAGGERNPEKLRWVFVSFGMGCLSKRQLRFATPRSRKGPG